MKQIWNVLFGTDNHVYEYRGADQRDTLTEIHFLSRTGVMLHPMEAARRSEPKKF